MIQARIPILTLVCALCLIAAPTGGHLAAQSAPDTCWVEGYIFGNDMKIAPRKTLEVRKVVKTGYLFAYGVAKHESDSTGYIRFPVPQGARVWLYADVPYLRTAAPDGIEKTIPNTPTARLEMLPTPTLQATQVLVVPQQRYTVKQDGVTMADTIHTLDVSGAIVTSPSPGTAHLQITGGSVVAYGDSIHVADSLARMRRVFISRVSTAITLDSSTDGAGRIYYTVSLDPDTVQAWLRDSSMTWMLGRVVQLADSGIAERGYMTPTQIRTLLAGYSVSGHAHAIADVSGLATALGDTASSNPRLTNIETTIQLVRDTLTAVSLRATSTANDLTAHAATADAHLPSQTGASGKFLQSNGTVSSWQTAITAETDPTALAKASSALDSALSGGSRSISTTGRMFASDDSITFIGEAGDIINAALGNVFRGTLSANDTLSISNMVDGQVITVEITNAGTFTLSWSGVALPASTTTTVNSGANKRTIYSFIKTGGKAPSMAGPVYYDE